MAESIKNNQFNNSEISRKYEKMAKHIKQLNSGIEEIILVHRAREDFDYIHIISNDEYELYQIAAYVRFNFGLDYEITTFRDYYSQEFDPYEMSVQRIKIVE